MAFTIPQSQSNPTWPAQAVPDSTDFAVITAGENGTGIISGLATTIASSSAYTYKVTVATGTYLISGTQYTLAAAVTGTGTVANTVGDRRDLVSINSAGTVTITTGSACAVTNWSTTSSVDPPVKPTIPAGNIALSEVYVPGSGSYTTPAAGWVTDKSLVIYNKYLTTSGGTMTGAIDMGSNKITGLSNATVSTDAAAYGQVLALSGGTMTGAIAMGSNKVTGLANGTVSTDAATYGQVTAISGVTSTQYTTTAVSVSGSWRVVPSGNSSGSTMSLTFTGQRCLFIFTCNQGGNATTPDVQIRLSFTQGVAGTPTQIGSTSNYYLLGNTSTANTRALYGVTGILDFGSSGSQTVTPYIQTASAAGATLGQFQLTLLVLP